MTAPPVTFFEAGRLFRLAQRVLLNDAHLSALKETPFPGLVLCSESRAVNAGFVLVHSSAVHPQAPPDSPKELLRRLVASRARFQLSQHAALPQPEQGPFPVWTIQAAARRRPFAATSLGNCAVQLPVDYLHGWAMMGEWINIACFPPLLGVLGRVMAASFLRASNHVFPLSSMPPLSKVFLDAFEP